MNSYGHMLTIGLLGIWIGSCAGAAMAQTASTATPSAVAPTQTAGADAPAPMPALTLAEQSLLDAESVRFRAQLEGNVAAVKEAIAPEAVYIHNTGMMQTGAQYLQMMAGTHYKKIEPSQRAARLYGDIGVTHGILDQDAGGDRQSVARYTGVYLRRDGRWLLLSWQTTPMTNHGPTLPPRPAVQP